MSFTGGLHEIVEKNESGLLGAHASWSRVPLGEVATILNGFPFDSKHFSKAEGMPLIRIRDILGASTDTKYTGPLPDGYWVTRGDLLVGMDGDFNCARWQGAPALLNQRVCKIAGTPEYIVDSFLHRVLGGYLAAINSYTSSITVKHLSSKTIADIPLPFPPLPEQKRIADKLDALLARVDACRGRLNRVPGIIKRFRQSVLAAATSGELTREWREERGIEGVWESARLADLGELGRGKSKHRPRNDFRLYGGPYPFIQTGDVAQSGGRIERHTQTYSELGLAQSRLWPASTVCITIAANIADTAILTYPACFPDSVVGFIADPAMTIPEFVKWSIDVISDRLESFAPATAQKNINLAILNEIEFPCPTLQEQAEIVRRVQLLFDSGSMLAARVAIASRMVSRLTPSVLAKAFRGELVPQDPNDEPASELLAKLKAERSNAAVAPSRRRAKTPGKRPTDLPGLVGPLA